MPVPKKMTTEVRVTCPKCGPNRVAHVVAQHVEHEVDEESGVGSWETFRILRCAGCRSMQVQSISEFSEDVDYKQAPDGSHYPEMNQRIVYWPPQALRPRPEWVPVLGVRDKKLFDLLTETYDALNGDMHVLAAIGMRTVFDRATELLKIDPALPFAQKLDELLRLGEISKKDQELLSVLTDAGSAAAHRGWRPTTAQLHTLALILESFIHRVFVLGSDAKSIKRRIPTKPKRRKK